MAKEPLLSIEVVYVRPGAVFRKRLSLPVGSTVRDAIRQSGFENAYPEVEITDGTVGVLSRRTGLAYRLVDHDRVEIYRPLVRSPNEIRKLRAERKTRRQAE